MNSLPKNSSLSVEEVKKFQSALIGWFDDVSEMYPWRATKDPYAILVSEVMLQQTTVQSVILNRRFERFMEEFPTVEVLSVASEEEILRAWEGLGYYNRVRNLQKTARAVLDDFEGVFPRTLALLQSLPGVGPYTSAAVASFAFGMPAPLVDANVSRVFSRIFDDYEPINSPKGVKSAWLRAADLLPSEKIASYNAGLMELGQKVCRNKEVNCSICPVSSFCSAVAPLELPKKIKKNKVSEVIEYALWCQKSDGSLFLEKGSGRRRKGLWTLPIVEKSETVSFSHLITKRYSITRYKVDLLIYECLPEDLNANFSGSWFTLEEQEALPMPSPVRQVVGELQARLI